MRPADTWKDYELLDATDGNRLERWGETILIRPDPQVVWKTPKKSPLWAKADAIYHRSNQGGGEWEYRRRLPDFQTIFFTSANNSWNSCSPCLNNLHIMKSFRNSFISTGRFSMLCSYNIQSAI